jgi:hypothetical protein
VVMEASGACTEPVYYALAGQDFEEIAVASPAHAKALRGHKTDAKDCARLAELSGCGLLRGSYIPSPELREVRDLSRYRTKTVQARTLGDPAAVAVTIRRPEIPGGQGRRRPPRCRGLQAVAPRRGRSGRR